jgi:hypothetical protein
MAASFEELKRVPLSEFCVERLGYKPNKGHDSRLWRSLVSPSGKKIITKNAPSKDGHYLFRCEDMGVGGSIIDLLLYVEGMDMAEIESRFGGVSLDSIPPPAFENEDEKDRDNTERVKDRMAELPKVGHSPERNYFTRRGISTETLQYFGLSASENRTIIPLYRRFSGRWVAQTSIQYLLENGERQRFFQKGLRRRGSYSILKKREKKLRNFSQAVLFESPIDALSYFQLKGKEALYISTCGSLSQALKTQLPLDLKKIGICEVSLAFDNDLAGARMISALRSVLGAEGFKVSVESPKKKDWNEDLCTN